MRKISFTDLELEKLRFFGVSCVYIFGSRAEAVAREKSDYDFALLFKDSKKVKPGIDTRKLYQNIYEIFAPICFKDITKGVIDMVFLQSGVSLELQANVIKFGKVLMDDDPELRANHEQQVMTRMADFKPILDQMDKAIIARI